MPPALSLRLHTASSALLPLLVALAVLAGVAPAARADVGTASEPGAPAAPRVEAGNGAVQVAWTPPQDDGGAPLLGYHLQVWPGTGPSSAWLGSYTAVYDPGAGELTVPVKEGNGTYSVSIAAYNARGLGPESATVLVTTTGTPARPFPVSGAGAAGDEASALVSWGPAWPNGAALTGFTVTVEPGSREIAVPVRAPDVYGNRSTRVEGLDNGTAYTFAVTATNAAGTSEAVTTAPVTPTHIDRTPPATEIKGTPDPVSYEDEATFLFAVQDDYDTPEQVSVTCAVDRGPATPCRSPFTVTGLAAGRHHLDIATTDRAGHVSPAVFWDWATVLEPAAELAVLDDRGAHTVLQGYDVLPDGTYPEGQNRAVRFTYRDGDTESNTVLAARASADGRRLAFLQQLLAGDGSPTRSRVRVSDSSGRPLSTSADLPAGTAQLSSPALSPDGSRVSWVQTAGGRPTLLTAPVAGDAPTPSQVGSYTDAVWLSASTLLAVTASGRLVTVRPAGGGEQPVAGQQEDVDDLAVAPGATALAWTAPSASHPTATSVRTAPLSPGADGWVLGAPATLSRPDVSALRPVFAVDGSSRVYWQETSTSGGFQDLVSLVPGEPGPPVEFAFTPGLAGFAATVRDPSQPGKPVLAPVEVSGGSAPRARLSWTLPADPDVTEVIITRTRGPVGTSSWQRWTLDRTDLEHVDRDLVAGAEYLYELRAVDRDGNWSAPVQRLVTAVSAPTLQAPTLTTSASAGLPFSVTLGPGDAGRARYEVQYRDRSAGTTFRPWLAAQRAGRVVFGAGSTPTAVRAGHTYDFRVRAEDARGNVTPWRTSSRTVVPYDQTRATFAGATATSTGSKRYLGSVHVLKAAGASARVSVTGDQLQVIGERCAVCGKADVWVDGRRVATIDTRSTTRTRRSVLYQLSWTGTVRPHSVKVVAKGTPGRPQVVLDAFSARR